jgi:hypothetical protein
MKVLVAKSTFLYEGAEVEPGDTLRAPSPQEGSEHLDAEHFTSTNLCESPAPSRHPGVTEVGDGLAISHGGGWYTYTKEDGTIIEDKIQGEAALQDLAQEGAAPEEE